RWTTSIPRAEQPRSDPATLGTWVSTGSTDALEGANAAAAGSADGPLVLHRGCRFGRVASMVGRIPVMDVMPLVDLGRLPAKATTGEPLPVTAMFCRERNDQLGAEVVLVAPDGTRRPPVRMVADGDAPDRYVAWVTPDAEGAWTFEVHAWSDPLATWEHDAGIKIPAGVDVELMFTEGGLLLDRVAADPDLPAADA